MCFWAGTPLSPQLFSQLLCVHNVSRMASEGGVGSELELFLPEGWVQGGVEKPVSYSQLSLKAEYAFNRGARSEFLLSLKGQGT